MKLQPKHIMVNAISSVLLAAPAVAFAQLTGSPTFAGTSGSGLIPAVVNIINYALILAGLVAAIVIVYGGVKYIISRGDATAAEEGKNAVLFAVIGLIIIGLAAALVNFVIGGIRQA